MSKNEIIKKSATLALQTLKIVAKSNANSLCRGLLYEPKVPHKLQK